MHRAQLNINRFCANLMCMNAQKKAQLNDWSDIHFAYQVARLGTLSAAAEALDVHHSTVLRRIDALEKRLKARLFHRHARGYTPTDAGKLLFKVAINTQEAFDLLMGQIAGADEQLTGTLVITSVETLSSEILPIIAEFQRIHPEIRIEYVADPRIFRLEHGEAHISIRPGAEPKDPDYIVQHLRTTASALFASREYLNRFGRFKGLDQLEKHRFISSLRPLRNIPFMVWLEDNVPANQIYCRTSDFTAMQSAVTCGIGIAPLSYTAAIKEAGLIQITDFLTEWQSDLWLVTHRDVHRTAKVQAFNTLLKQRLRNN